MYFSFDRYRKVPSVNGILLGQNVEKSGCMCVSLIVGGLIIFGDIFQHRRWVKPM